MSNPVIRLDAAGVVGSVFALAVVACGSSGSSPALAVEGGTTDSEQTTDAGGVQDASDGGALSPSDSETGDGVTSQASDAGTTALTGTWSSQANATNGIFTWNMMLIQYDGGSISGSVPSYVDQSTGQTLVLGTILSGYVNGSAVVLYRMDTTGGFQQTWNATVAPGGNSMSGTATNADGGSDGTWTAERQ